MYRVHLRDHTMQKSKTIAYIPLPSASRVAALLGSSLRKATEGCCVGVNEPYLHLLLAIATALHNI